MGDTGSLMLGGVIAVLAIILRKELLNSSSMWDFLNRKSIGNAASSGF